MDIMFLIGRRPPSEEGKFLNLLKEVCSKTLPTASFGYTYVVTESGSENIKKPELVSNIQRICDYVMLHHPKVIVPMGVHAFKLLKLPNDKITEIQCTPQRSPLFGRVHSDFRTTKKALSENIVGTESSPIYVDNDVKVRTTMFNPWIWAMHNLETYLGFGGGYKAILYLEDQIRAIKNLLEPTFEMCPPEYFDEFINYHTTGVDINEGICTLKRLQKVPILSFDIESAGLGVPKEAQLNPKHPKARITLIAFGELINKKVRVHVFDTLKVPKYIPYIKELLLVPEIKWLSWNGKFDFSYIKHLWGVTIPGKHVDGVSALYLYDMSRNGVGKGSGTLKTNCSLLLHPKFAGYHKHNDLDIAMKNGDGDYLNKYWREFSRYCGIDVYVTYGLVTRLWNSLPEKSRGLVTKYYEELNDTLTSIHEEGMFIDLKLLDEYISSLTTFCNSLEKSCNSELQKILCRNQINTLKSGEFKINSKKCQIEVLYDILKLEPKYTDKGSLSVDKATLAGYVDIPFVEIIVTYNYFVQQLRLMETLKSHTNKEGYCFPHYNSIRTASGRLSCSSPNIQQLSSNCIRENTKELGEENILKSDEWITKIVIPHREVFGKPEVKKKNSVATVIELSPKLKKVIIPPKGFSLLYADYKQVEVYVLGNYIYHIGSSDTGLQDALIGGLDIHCYTASNIYSIITGQEYTYDFIHENKSVYPFKGWRDDSKSVLFSLIYGKGPITFAKERGIPEEQAIKLFDVFYQGFPGIKEYMEYSLQSARKKGMASTIMGHERKIRILSYQKWNSKGKNQSYNTPIQGTAGTLVLTALIRLKHELEKIGGRIAFTVHDSIGVYIPTPLLDKGIAIQRWCMEEYPSIAFPNFLKIPLKISLELCLPSWGETEEYDLSTNPYRVEYRKEKDELAFITKGGNAG